MTEQQSERRVAEIFNSCVASFAISAAWELGLFDRLVDGESVQLSEFCAEENLHEPSVSAMVDALTCNDIVRRDAETGVVRAGGLFEDVYATKGFFHWLTRGSGQVFMEMPDISRNPGRVDGFLRRDHRAIAVATRDLGYRYFDEPFFDVLNGIPFKKVADLGCGSAERLIRMASLRPHLRGVGVDFSHGALELADEAIAAAGLDHQIELVEADARYLSHKDEFDGADLLTCFLMGHDFWPRAECVESLRRLRDAFPDVETFILCDTYRSEEVPCNSLPVFTLAFEVGHALMGKYLPTLNEWMGVFEEGGWKCVSRRDIPVPAYTSIFVLQPTG